MLLILALQPEHFRPLPIGWSETIKTEGPLHQQDLNQGPHDHYQETRATTPLQLPKGIKGLLRPVAIEC